MTLTMSYVSLHVLLLSQTLYRSTCFDCSYTEKQRAAFFMLVLFISPKQFYFCSFRQQMLQGHYHYFLAKSGYTRIVL